MKGYTQCPGESVPDQGPVWAVPSQLTFQICSRFVVEPSLQDLNILKGFFYIPVTTYGLMVYLELRQLIFD